MTEQEISQLPSYPCASCSNDQKLFSYKCLVCDLKYCNKCMQEESACVLNTPQMINDAVHIYYCFRPVCKSCVTRPEVAETMDRMRNEWLKLHAETVAALVTLRPDDAKVIYVEKADG